MTMKDADAKKLLLVILGALIGTLAYMYWRLDLTAMRDTALDFTGLNLKSLC